MIGDEWIVSAFKGFRSWPRSSAAKVSSEWPEADVGRSIAHPVLTRAATLGGCYHQHPMTPFRS
jgi:hypothetical protein